MTESRLQRWLRIKNETRKEEVTPATTIEPELSPEEQELAINEALPEQEVLAKYALPDPDAIELGTDITGFMRKEIPEFLRRRALRALWRSNPVLAVLDGLNDYDEDYTDAAHVGSVVKTIYKVGQGFLDKTEKSDEQVEQQSIPLESITSLETSGKKDFNHTDQSARLQPEVLTAATAEPFIEKTESEVAVEVLGAARHYHPADTETVLEDRPRYRPRMAFRS